MFTFSQEVTPALKAHIDAQYSMFADLSQKMFDTAQKINELNIQAAKTLLEGSLSSAQQVIVAKDPYEALSIAAAQAQPSAERVREYQQHLNNIAARTHLDLAKTAETHVPNTSRTAAAVADEVARKGNEETEKAASRQKAAFERFKTTIDRGDEQKPQANRPAA
ncbi:phasin family protein [Noviherbaspirillum malthae]|jgi:phasin family protein|uniref:phasin family protein n=1 Tax=Noviherbaspirillum malthae TaxID=1260987 RepID=UPI001E3FD5FC|nr:phasin family protein [Noviherbaspirillum malthae]